MSKLFRLGGILVGAGLAFFSFVFGVAWSAGGTGGGMNFGFIGALCYIHHLFLLLGISFGGLLVAFSISDLWYCLRDAFILPEPESSTDPINNDLRKNAMICQLASRLAILAGVMASILDFIVVMAYKLGGDTAIVGLGIAQAMAVLFWGFMLAALFTALKFRFLSQVQHEE